MEKAIPKVGDGIKADEWFCYETLEKSDGWQDSGFPGCEFRVLLPRHNDIKLAVNVKVTGKPRWNGVRWESRCRIEFVGDCEPSTFSGGLLYHD
jgi:hypothetical protein